jgi:arylsulfatase A-like enzyme
MRRLLALIGATFALGLAAFTTPATAQTTDKPNIVVIWGDDIGFWNVGAYSRGMMGYQTPNIDRIANEGALFTDMYAQQSCQARHRASPRTSPPLLNC